MTRRPAQVPRDVAVSTLGVLAGVAGTALALGLAAWASLDGRTMAAVDPPSLAIEWPRSPSGPAPTTTPTATSTSSSSHAAGLGIPVWVWEVVGTLVVLALVALAVRLVVRLLRAWKPAPQPEAPGTEAIDLVLGEEDAERQRAALATGSPRNAVVACWVELERLVAQAGIPRRSSETSSELVLRVLADRQVPREPLTALAALFREARFSRHELREEDRDRARASLDDIHAALRRPALGGTSGGASAGGHRGGEHR